MASLTLSSTTSHGEALALAGALLEWCTIQEGTYKPARVYCEHRPDGSMTITTTPPLRVVK